ncbi:hypothetical protein HU200_063667 [Digitaria exilis]|uniref:DUF4378 domain-containing protein n=1 Tax=Digitaria exilis TaxID=1010633 RepID=A0A835DYS3_9POAL|nr:hypothetical protein HU200_063667 [Digitaria exilis]CAB3490039.1 unnamed protein product [Digitaria exilis]CAB3490057.1 unnamed protein product [Digitaria exilis]
MACLSPSPSGRRLSELLEEKQEPFFLDLHLLEKGCSSSRLLDGYDTALCWPAVSVSGNDAASAVLKRLTSRKNKTSKKQQPSASGGLLKLLLSKILRGRSAAPPRKPAALQFSDSFKIAAVAPAPPPCAAVKTAGGEAKVEQDKDSCCYSDGEYYSDEEKQQLSPVSVLEHPFESNKMSPSKNNAMDVFRELLDAAYSPALLTQLLAKTNDLVAGDEDDDYYYRTSPKNCREDESAAAYWDTHRAELARVSELVASEVPASKLAAGDVGPERQDVGAEVEAAVFDALLMELVVELGNGCC